MRMLVAGVALILLVVRALGHSQPGAGGAGGTSAEPLLNEANGLLAATSATGRCPDELLAKLLLNCRKSPEPAVTSLVAALRSQQTALARQAIQPPGAAMQDAPDRRGSAIAELLCHLSRVRRDAERGSSNSPELGGFTLWQRLQVRAEGAVLTLSSEGLPEAERQSFFNPPSWEALSFGSRTLSVFSFCLPAASSNASRAIDRFRMAWDAKPIQNAELSSEVGQNQLSVMEEGTAFHLRSSLRFAEGQGSRTQPLVFLRGRGAWPKGEGRAVLAAEALTLHPAAAGKEIPNLPLCFVPTCLAYKHAGQNLRVVDAFPGAPDAVPAVAMVRYADGTYAQSEKDDPAVGAGLYISLLTVKQRLPNRRFILDDGGLSIMDRSGAKTLLFARLVEGVLDATEGELSYELRVVRSMKEQSRWIRELLACPRLRVRLSQGAPLLDFLAETKDLTVSGTAPCLGLASIVGSK